MAIETAGKWNCLMCGAELKTTNSMLNYGRRFGYIQKWPWCIECVKRIFETIKDTYKNDERAFFELCRIGDVPYITAIVPHGAVVSTNVIKAMRSYNTALGTKASAARRDGFLAGDITTEVQYMSTFGEKSSDGELRPGVSTAMYKKYGCNNDYTVTDYDIMEDDLSKIIKANPTANDAQITQAILAVRMRLQLNRAINNGDFDAIGKYTTAIEKQLESAKLRTKDAAGDNKNETPVCSVFKMVEMGKFIHPEEYIPHYPYPRDMADKALLDILNQGRRNKGESAWPVLPQEFVHDDELGEFGHGSDENNQYIAEIDGYETAEDGGEE